MTNKGKLSPGLKGMVNVESVIAADSAPCEWQPDNGAYFMLK